MNDIAPITDEVSWKPLIRMLERRIMGPYRHGRRWRFQVWTTRAAPPRYVSFAKKSEALRYASRERGDLYRRSAAMLAKISGVASTKSGWVYVVALTPEINARRLKVGFTKSPIKNRLATYRTTNPHASLLAIWDGDRSDEERVLRLLSGRVGTSEVFHVRSAVDSLKKLEQILGQRRL